MLTISSRPSTTDDSIFNGLAPGDLYRYSRTCKDAHYAVSSYFRRTKSFDLHKILERYFPPQEVFKFRELQAVTGMLISGSTAVQFFDCTEYPESDLDLYVEHRYCRPIAWWLIGLGYKLLPPTSNPFSNPYETLESVPDHQTSAGVGHYTRDAPKKGYFGATSVLTFEMAGLCRTIQLITSDNTPLEKILNFHSSMCLSPSNNAFFMILLS